MSNRPPNRADDLVAELMVFARKGDMVSIEKRYNEYVKYHERFRNGKQIGGVSAMEGAVIRGRLREAMEKEGIKLP